MNESFPQPHVPLFLDNSLLFHPTNQRQHIQLATHCMPYIRLPKMTGQYNLRMASAICVEALDNSQHSVWLVPKSQSFALKISFFHIIVRNCTALN
jgi:hypothetical protein